MNILLLLYLAHYLGDYPLQTNWIYAQKIKSWKGGFYHAGEIFLSLLICLAPFLHNMWAWLAIISIVIVHYIQDNAKLIFDRAVEREKIGYFTDQLLHIISSTIFWLIFIKHQELSPMFGETLYSNIESIMFFIGLILITYVFEITIYVIKNADRKEKTPLKRNWKLLVGNGAVYSIVYFAIMFFIN